MDSNGNLFFVLINPIALACWNSETSYSRRNIKIVLIDNKTLQFASGVKIARNLAGVEELWISTNRLQVHITLVKLLKFRTIFFLNRKYGLEQLM